jgi:hypothetical protein
MEFPRDFRVDIGKEEQAVAFLQALRNAGKQQEIKSFTDCTYVSFKQEGISFCFKPKIKVRIATN